MIKNFTILLFISFYFLSCQAIQKSSEQAFSNANSAIKNKVFIPNDKKEDDEKAKK